ncbi:conserved exported protein of unknown function [Pseudorhizobium banfieldiae]|uniref:DUF3150 domain-containing protein n=1 Tax=Pseudorhizobium banfieldiae TaxID=1125847 RepID=L0NDM3_9HYPH|nr:hypothetical protein [Pseudorhizobium banfieldiae]CAD6606134.1 hypothetical protein RNT25_01793 [arsenite-oxidising bacterium NT-25]CCF19140.1 conserved exported protein of unknown function [Pseudorhizobium banfieldiae]
MNAMTPIAPAATASLSTRAMLVSLSISQWSGRRLDREITDEVNQQHNAAADAGRYNKLLLPKEALEPIVKIVSATRTDFLTRTLPWMDNGSRIMAAEAYLAHMGWIRQQKVKFDDAVNDFLAKYPGYVNDARVRLNGMFKDEDYPDVDTLRAKFSLDCKVMPVPSSSDFRVDMSEAQASIIRADIEEQLTKATTAAVQDVYKRVADVAGRMVERLNAYKPAKGKGDKAEGIFRDSLVENVRDLIKILPALNITGDPKLAAMAEQLKPLAEYDASVLREDEGKRRDVAAEAQSILDTVSGFLA